MGKIENVMGFYLLASELKYKIRTGWDDTHWNILGDRRESVAEHVFGTCMLAIAIASEFELKLDMNKVLKMLALHEIGEALIPDISPFDGITPEEKARIEHLAMQEVIGDLMDKDEIYNLLLEFDAHETDESKFAYLIDKIEADIQAKRYQDKGLQHSLDDQPNNVTFNYSSILKLVEGGATTAFDIWYGYDKSKYENDPLFMEILDFVRDHNTSEIVEKKKKNYEIRIQREIPKKDE
jgi:putative hydrolase of HD superfamily